MSDDKPVTDEELAEIELLCRGDQFDKIDVCVRHVPRLIAALRESRKAEEYWHNQAYLMEGKLAEIRAVAKASPGLPLYTAYRRLTEAIDKPTDSNTRKPELFLPE